ncbi:barstar family protein [Kitasatospora aureofaciens]|uniref:barstar family protein n=1 Tax=Kitasatospora aureofaciens TaxID=1894 RepID=UPI0005276674|nr:barstar family protein [Kitasatospora aureofaciens]HJD81580.1 barstar family protein [Kitasatospora aureofaciens]
MTVTYVIDGLEIDTLEDFWDVVGQAIGVDGYFGHNLDAFADCLGGGYGTPDDDDYVIEWRHHEVSRRRLGYPETVRQLELRLARVHPTNREQVAAELAAARAGKGPTVFDWLVDIIEERHPGGLRLA